MLAGLTPPEYLAAANSETIAFAMVETPAALAALDEILAVEGLDAVFVGPGDLSLTLSEGKGLAPSSDEVQGHAADIAARAKAAGKLAGIFCNTAADAIRAREMGYGYIAYGVDMAMFLDEAARKRAEIG
jgi:4-hydroxy-2-oxoheptanedioate aldolase